MYSQNISHMWETVLMKPTILHNEHTLIKAKENSFNMRELAMKRTNSKASVQGSCSTSFVLGGA